MQEKKQLSKGSIFVLCALFLILAAQLNINLIINGFKISLSVILFPMFYFLLEEFMVIPTTFVVAPGVLLVRCIMEWIGGIPWQDALVSYGPEMVFYLIYGMLFWLATRLVDFHRYQLVNILSLVAIDLLSNMGELLVRLGADAFHGAVILRIVVVAVGRSLLAAVILGGLSLYGDLTLRKDERERYKKLLLLISQMKGEIIWMEKNAVAIEDTMTVSYQLYNRLKEQGSEEMAQKALTVAKDVHEVKKEYRLIMKGLSETLNKDMEEQGMWISEILDILREGVSRFSEDLGKESHLTINCSYDFYTDKHYYLMSILRNLLHNAVEALEEGCAHLELTVSKVQDSILFQVHDDCGGIQQEYLDAIFRPGFSTKFSEKTGEVNRGLGLALVYDMVTEELNGQIQVESDNGQTTFSILIPATNLEVHG